MAAMTWANDQVRLLLAQRGREDLRPIFTREDLEALRDEHGGGCFTTVTLLPWLTLWVERQVLAAGPR